MFAKRAFVLVLLLVLGSFVSSGRYVEDSSEQRYDDSEEAKENESERDLADEDDNEYDEEDEQENRDARADEEADAREEVVKIRPGQSEDEDEGNSEDDDAEFEEADDLNDDRMMDGNEGGMSLTGHEEENMADEGVFESFKKKAEEINKENENMQAEISDLNAKFDEALSSDNDDAARSLPVDTKAAIQDDSTNSEQSLSKDNSDTSNDVSHTASQHAAFIEDDVMRRYAEMGEDAYVDPDDDY